MLEFLILVFLIMRFSHYTAIFILIVTFCACTVTKKVKTGDMAFQYKQYVLATELLSQEYESTSNTKEKARKAFYLAQSYEILQDHGEALKWYDIADQLNYRSDSEIDLAYALKRNERYEEAAQLFQEIYKKTKLAKYRSESAICAQAIEDQDNIDQFIITPFTANSQYSDYSPTYYENDFLIFSSDRVGSTGNNTYKWNEHNFSDIYITNLRGRNVHNFDGTLNTEANEGTLCFNKTFDEIFFTRCSSDGQRDQYCSIYFSMKPNDFWIEAEPMMFFDSKTNFGHPALIENDSVLIFSAAPNGSDNHDLYYSERLEVGWSEAELMPPSINTVGEEKFPTVFGDTLYFSSDGLAGYGGLDIFKSYLKSDGSWSRPENLGIPINSGTDDFSYVLDPNYVPKGNIKRQGYFTSARNTGSFDDIFYFAEYVEKEGEEEDIVEEEIVEDEEDKFKIYLAGRVVEVKHKNNDPNKAIIGKNKLKGALVEFSSSSPNFDIKSDGNGRFLLDVDALNYKIRGTKKDYLSYEMNLDLSGVALDRDTTINIEIPLEKIMYNKEIVIDNIYYDYEKWDIRDDAKPALDTLKNILVKNPSIKIQLGSHTDCRGEFDYNSELSQKRAQSAVDYLAQLGIQKSRLIAKGYGELKPSIECECTECTEEQHQINRRTTFTILR